MEGRMTHLCRRPLSKAFWLMLVVLILFTLLDHGYLSKLVHFAYSDKNHESNTNAFDNEHGFIHKLRFGNDRLDHRPGSHEAIKDTQQPIQERHSGSVTTKTEVGYVARTEVRHVMFLKVHKTGSTTTQNIFLRFGFTRNLTFLLASVKHNECGGFPNCISYYNTLTYKNIWPPPPNKSFEILCSHVIYKRENFRKFLPEDTVNIGIVREPIKRLASAINFFQLLKNIDFSTYANDPARYAHAMINNRMAYEFGFRLEWLPVTSNKTLTSAERDELSDYINQLDRDFALIIVMERYHESLVLLKRILHWTTKDIIYSRQGSRGHRKFEENDSKKLKQYLYLDFMLYDFAVKRLEQRISEAGDDFFAEVKDFDALNKRVNTYCNGMKHMKLIIEASRWYGKFEVDRDYCNILRKDELSFIDKIRKTQYRSIPQPYD